MAIRSTQGFQTKLVANDIILDLFQDEEIKISNNITNLFDVGVIPSDFSRTIMLPGTKKNNAFFEHVYDISVTNPYLFATNTKVSAYLDFDGIYLVTGYLQLNKVTVYENKFIDSYEISLYGIVSSFSRDINRLTLNDLSSLNQFNHTSSFTNISSSWGGNLFSGAIVYPMAEYGQEIFYTPTAEQFGIDDVNGALCVEDFKPAIRVKEVWDAIFEQAGYTYSSSFMNQPFLDNVYMVCNNALKYPKYTGIDLETYGLCKIAPVSGSGSTDLTLPRNVTTPLPWYNIQNNPTNTLSASLEYTLDFSSRLRGEINLNFELTSTGTGSAAPQFSLVFESSSVDLIEIPLTNINNYMLDIQTYNGAQTRTQKFDLKTEWNQVNSGIYTALPANTPVRFSLLQTAYDANTNYTITLDPDGTPKSYLSITKVNNAADGRVMDIPFNMPFGTTGIKLVDFIKGFQKKFNLIIYPDRTNTNNIIIETFNDWYNKGEIKDFNKYLNLNKPIDVISANNLAVNKLNFGDTLDTDYVSQQFAKGANREYGKQYYVDTTNFFSQGEFEVKTTFASSPLAKVSGTGISGSVGGISPSPTHFSIGICKVSYVSSASNVCGNFTEAAFYELYTDTGTFASGKIVYTDPYGNNPVVGFNWIVENGSGNEVYGLNSITGEIGMGVGIFC
jgi:hypothetical protein